MKLNKIKSPQLNQNGYHKNLLTKERIGTIFIYPIDFTPDDCLSCDGYSLLIEDFQELYSIIGTKFNQANDEVGRSEFLITMFQKDFCNQVAMSE